MLQFESPSYPHTLAQWLYVLLATFLGGGGLGAWLTAWVRRKHGPAEVRKIEAEVRSITIRDDIALGDSVTRLIKEISQATVDAEQRRMDWLQREEELRTQIRFWRNKAEELDGRLLALGGRVDGEDGWLWAIHDDEVYGHGSEGYLTADDEYLVTHWAEIEWPTT